MAKMQDFSPAQREEALNWYKENCPEIWNHLSQLNTLKRDFMDNLFLDVYFKLKIISIELKPNQFVIGIDYKSTGSAEKDMEEAILGNVQFNLSFWNPHPKGVTDKLAKDFLIAKLSTL